MIARLRNVALVLLAVTATPLLAQSTPATQNTAAPHASAAAAGPRVELTATGVRQLTRADTADVVAAAKKQQLGKPVALMIVGGAALVVGLVIGGDAGTIIALGGLVTGLIGLYQYLQ